jgi:hypothetical protein
VASSVERLKSIARAGRVAAQSAKAQAHRSATQRRHAAGRKSWNPSDQPAWLTEATYREKIQPQLAGVPNTAIVSALGVSVPYAVSIRHGNRTPHPRHWEKLAELAGISDKQVS